MAIQSELQVPVKYIGVGEKIEDLQRFDPSDFVDALFDVEPEAQAETVPESVVETETTSEPDPAEAVSDETASDAPTAAEPEDTEETTPAVSEESSGSGWTMPAWVLESIAQEEAARQADPDREQEDDADEEKKEKVSFWKKLWS